MLPIRIFLGLSLWCFLMVIIWGFVVLKIWLNMQRIIWCIFLLFKSIFRGRFRFTFPLFLHWLFLLILFQLRLYALEWILIMMIFRIRFLFIFSKRGICSAPLQLPPYTLLGIRFYCLFIPWISFYWTRRKILRILLHLWSTEAIIPFLFNLRQEILLITLLEFLTLFQLFPVNRYSILWMCSTNISLQIITSL